nr:uncharacterized protein LOC124809654 [Hydra vulgaris]
MYEHYDYKLYYWELIIFICIFIIVYKCFQNGLNAIKERNERSDNRLLLSTIRRHNLILNAVFVVLTICLMFEKLQDKKPVVIGLICSFNENAVIPFYLTLLELVYCYNIFIALLNLVNSNFVFNGTKRLLLIEILFSIATYWFSSYLVKENYINFWILIVYETIVLLGIELVVLQRGEFLCLKQAAKIRT